MLITGIFRELARNEQTVSQNSLPKRARLCAKSCVKHDEITQMVSSKCCACAIALKIFLHEILFCLISVPAFRSNQEDKSSPGTLISAR